MLLSGRKIIFDGFEALLEGECVAWEEPPVVLDFNSRADKLVETKRVDMHNALRVSRI